MNKCLYLILLIGLFGCSHPKQSDTNTTEASTDVDIDTADQFMDDVKLNGVINTRNNLKNVTNYLGEPSTDTTYYYFKGAQFLNDNDTLILTYIDISKFHDLFLQTNKLRMDFNTTIDDFRKYYPKYANDEIDEKDKDKIITIVIPQKITKDLWWFYFDRKSGKLLNINFEPPDI